MNSVCKICFDIFLEGEALIEDEGYFSHLECFESWAEEVRIAHKERMAKAGK